MDVAASQSNPGHPSAACEYTVLGYDLPSVRIIKGAVYCDPALVICSLGLKKFGDAVTTEIMVLSLACGAPRL